MSRSKRNEDLQVGDVVATWEACKWVRIVAIRPYVGPLVDIIFAIVDTKPGLGFSLARGGYAEVA